MKTLTYAVRVRQANGVLSVETPALNRDMAKRLAMAACRVTAASILSVKVAQRYPTKSALIDLCRTNNVEVFHVDARDAGASRNNKNEDMTRVGWYYWTCLPGCLPDSTAFGPFNSPLGALRDAYDNDFLGQQEDL